MIDDQLTATVKEIGQRFFAIWAVKDIFLVDLNPRQLAAMTAYFVT
jgi:hypothetical protein